MRSTIDAPLTQFIVPSLGSWKVSVWPKTIASAGRTKEKSASTSSVGTRDFFINMGAMLSSRVRKIKLRIIGRRAARILFGAMKVLRPRVSTIEVPEPLEPYE